MDPRSSAPRAAKVSSDSEDDEDEDESSGPEASTSQRRPRRDSNASSTDGFDDNFAPFVSAASGNHTLAAALSSPSLDDTSAPKFPSSSDYPPFADAGEEDPTAHLTDMFASFAGLREKALNMQDRNQRMNFAEEIAMKFAKQLDLLMGDELDTIPDVPLPELADSSNDGKKAENDQADKSEAKYASGTSEMTPESEVAAKSEGKSGDDNSKTQ